MNASLFTADRATHLKIAVLAVLGCVSFVAIGLNARTTGNEDSAVRQSPELAVAVPHAVEMRRATDINRSRIAALAD